MTNKSGVYLSANGDSAIRIIIENNEKLQTDRITISDELISELEFNLGPYEKVVEYIMHETEPLDGIGAYAEEQLSNVFSKAFELADAVRENDLTAGILLRASINKLLNIEDDQSAMFLLTTMNSIVEILQEPLNTKYILYKHLKSQSEFETRDEWLQKDVLSEGYFFHRNYSCEIINTDLFSGEPRMSQAFFFNDYSDYFVFLFLKFAEQNKRVLECPCCGKLFVPKSNRAEIYCDRILTNGKTCKQIAPKLARKVKQRNDPLIDEYERTKNRYYKRVERFEDSGENSSVMRLTFNDYKTWLDKASEVKRLYLQGKASRDEFREIIHSID